MPRTKKSAGEKAASQDIKAANKEAKRLNDLARKLLKNAGKDIRQVRSEVSKLKKAGIVSSRIDARNYIPSKYMLTKLRKNADILSGEAIAVKATREVRRKYKEKGLFETRGTAIIVPKEAENMRARIKRGFVELTRPLKWGEEIRLVLPFKATDMEGVANGLLNDPTLDGMKMPDELFGFRLFGHNMNTIGFPSAEELAEYILRHYNHLFSGKNGQAAVKQFQLIRFKRQDSQLSEAPEEYKTYSPRKNRPQTDWYLNRKLMKDAARKKKERDKETPEARQKRLDRQRIRSAQNRQRKFDEK